MGPSIGIEAKLLVVPYAYRLWVIHAVSAAVAIGP
jgi:hypothetical protein